MFEYIAGVIAIGSVVAIWWIAEREMREGHRARITRMEEDRGRIPFEIISLPRREA